MRRGVELKEYLKDNCEQNLARMIISIAESSKVLSHAIRNAGLMDLTGSTEAMNIQGESVQKLDDFSNRLLMDYCTASQVCAGYLSEENDGVTTLNKNGLFTVAIDPLDGSSNIDVAAPIGTIFSINHRISEIGTEVSDADFLQVGTATVGAGFVLYGSGTLLIFSTGKGVQIFTLDAEEDEFRLSIHNVKLPEIGKIYSINQGSLSKFEDATKKFVAYCTAEDEATSRPFSLRYIGSMVGDMYRTFIKGGVFMYPLDKKGKSKLRILYECIPMAYLAEHAGGSATDGLKRILEIQPTAIHERCAIVIGSKKMVELYATFATKLQTI